MVLRPIGSGSADIRAITRLLIDPAVSSFSDRELAQQIRDADTMQRLAKVSSAAPMWRERERRSRPPPEGASPTVTKGLFATPSERGTSEPEPAWKLSSVLDETELQERHEERMLLDEQAKFELVADLYQKELEESAAHRQEILAIIEEDEAAAQQTEADEAAQVEEDNEALRDEIEALVRELRMQAHEDGLRQVEAHTFKAHQTNLNAARELEHEVDTMQELYMSSVLAQQERVLEEQEHEKFEGCQCSYALQMQLDADSKEAIEHEEDQNEQRARRMAAEEQAHAQSCLEEEAALERLAREQEEKDQLANNADLVGTLTDGKEAMRVLVQRAQNEHAALKSELQERHDIFVSQVNEQVVLLHVEAEKARRREWAKRDLTFRRSEELLHKARDIVKNIDSHVEELDGEFQAIAERRDVWPPGPSYSQPHQRTKPRSAGAKFDQQLSALERPVTAPLRQRSAQRREMMVKVGRASAPQGFAYAVRIVFEHMDKMGKGDLDENEMLEGMRLLGLDTHDVSLASVFSEVDKDASSRIDFKDFEEMVMSVLGVKKKKAPGKADEKETWEVKRVDAFRQTGSNRAATSVAASMLGNI
jgi:hypothetical protein